MKWFKCNTGGSGFPSTLGALLLCPGSPGARRSRPSLSWRSKSIQSCHWEDSTAEEIRGVKRHLEPRGGGGALGFGL